MVRLPIQYEVKIIFFFAGNATNKSNSLSGGQSAGPTFIVCTPAQIDAAPAQASSKRVAAAVNTAWFHVFIEKEGVAQNLLLLS